MTPEQFRQYLYAGGANDQEATERILRYGAQNQLTAQQLVDLTNAALGTNFTPADLARATDTSVAYGDGSSARADNITTTFDAAGSRIEAPAADDLDLVDGLMDPDEFRQYIYAGGADDREATERLLQYGAQNQLTADQLTALTNAALGTNFTDADLARAVDTSTTYGDGSAAKASNITRTFDATGARINAPAPAPAPSGGGGTSTTTTTPPATTTKPGTTDSTKVTVRLTPRPTYTPKFGEISGGAGANAPDYRVPRQFDISNEPAGAFTGTQQVGGVAPTSLFDPAQQYQSDLIRSLRAASPMGVENPGFTMLQNAGNSAPVTSAPRQPRNNLNTFPTQPPAYVPPTAPPLAPTPAPTGGGGGGAVGGSPVGGGSINLDNFVWDGLDIQVPMQGGTPGINWSDFNSGALVADSGLIDMLATPSTSGAFGRGPISFNIEL